MTLKPAVIKQIFLSALLVSLSLTARSQFTVYGSATSSGNDCFILTPASSSQAGAVWYDQPFSLENYFDLKFEVYLGDNDAGGDGIAFVIQPGNSGVGGPGGNLGYSGISPSVAVEYDTYHSSSPSYDQIAIHKDGDASLTGLIAGPVQASSTSDDIEDGQWHSTRITWDPSTKILKVSFDGIHRLTYTGDLVADIFGGNPTVHWGFTGATGGGVNLQQFCVSGMYFGSKPAVPISPWVVVTAIFLITAVTIIRFRRSF